MGELYRVYTLQIDDMGGVCLHKMDETGRTVETWYEPEDIASKLDELAKDIREEHKR